MPNIRIILLSLLTAGLAAQEPLPTRLEKAQRLDVTPLQALQAEVAQATLPAAWKAYHQAHLEYSLANTLRGKGDKAARREAEDHLERAILALQGRPDAESLALLGSALGVKIDFAPMSAMGLSRKAAALFEQAEKLAPGNPRVRLLHGIHVYFTPSMFGGGANKAEALFEAAARSAAVETPGADPWAPRWGRVEALAWLALAQMDQGKASEAQQTLDQALALDPEYGFARNHVLPRIQKAPRG